MASNPVQRKWTVEEYFAYEQEIGIKHEYLDGEIYAMAGGTDNHAEISNNIGGELRNRLRNKHKLDCRIFSSDMRMKITDIKYVYPDLSVVCGEAKFADANRTMLTNPTLVIEVSSPSTANYDKAAKADFYQSLPSVEAYLVLQQDEPLAQLYTRQEKGWFSQKFSGLEAVVPLEAIGCSLPLSEAYLNIDFEED